MLSESGELKRKNPQQIGHTNFRVKKIRSSTIESTWVTQPFIAAQLRTQGDEEPFEPAETEIS